MRLCLLRVTGVRLKTNKCEYLRNLKCGGNTEQECVDAMKRDTVKLGGDTVVIQRIGDYKGQPGKFLI